MTPEFADVRHSVDTAERSSSTFLPLRLTPHPSGRSRREAALSRALRFAADQVRDGSSTATFADSPPATSVHDLCDAVLQWAYGNSAVEALPAGTGAIRLLGELRVAFLCELEKVSVRVGASEVILAMRAFDAIAGLLEAEAAGEAPDTSSEPHDSGIVVEVAHDMRSPLSSILFLVETLRRGQSGGVNPVQERQLGLVYGAALGLSSLASDLIEFGRGGERLLEGGPTPFSVREIFEGVRDIVLPIAEEKALELRIDPPESDRRMGHPIALQRVLLNLTTNALKFTNHGFVAVSARQLPGGRVAFAISDSGCGIPAHVLPALCEGMRTPNARGARSFSSAGLGLSICRKLVKRMGGEIRVQTSQGVGSSLEFTLDLPVAPRI